MESEVTTQEQLTARISTTAQSAPVVATRPVRLPGTEASGAGRWGRPGRPMPDFPEPRP